MQTTKVKQEIFELLAQVDVLLLAAECDGEQLVSLDCYKEVETALNRLNETVEYYVD